MVNILWSMVYVCELVVVCVHTACAASSSKCARIESQWKCKCSHPLYVTVTARAGWQRHAVNSAAIHTTGRIFVIAADVFAPGR